MARERAMRFERDGRFVELWLEPGEPWQSLWRREGALDRPDRARASAVELEHAFAAESTQHAHATRLLEEGWQWVPDGGAPAWPTEPIPDGLEEALRAGDDSAEQVYADWLQQRAHPRGVLIELQRALEQRPGDPALEAAVGDVFEAHRDVLLGSLAAHLAPPTEHHDPYLELGWRRGFIDTARLGRFHDDTVSIVHTLLRHPSARFLRTLEIGCHHGADQNNSLISALLVHITPAPPLRRLVLADFDHSFVDQIDISRAHLGDLTGLGAQYPLLEDVQLRGRGDVELGELALPNARRFALQTSSLQWRALAAIAAAPWPRLEDLELWFGDPADGYGAECRPEEVAALLAAELPALRMLRLVNASFSDEIVDPVADCPLAARLEVLDFSLGTLSDAGAARLVARRPAFPRLAALKVYDNALTDDALAALRAAGFVVDEDPPSPAERQCLAWRQESTNGYDRWRRPRCTQKRDRFVSVSE